MQLEYIKIQTQILMATVAIHVCILVYDYTHSLIIKLSQYIHKTEHYRHDTFN